MGSCTQSSHCPVGEADRTPQNCVVTTRKRVLEGVNRAQMKSTHPAGGGEGQERLKDKSGKREGVRQGSW